VGSGEHITSDGKSCWFNPPTNVSFISIHAVGGGGAGNNNIDNLSNSTQKTAVSFLAYNNTGIWPDWFKYFMERKSNNWSKDGYESFETKKTYWEQELPYGLGGEPGEVVSMVFPSISKRVYMTPGLGAAISATENSGNGDDTVVKFGMPGSQIEIIKAAGGKSFNSTGLYSSELSGGEATDFGVGKFQSVKMKSSDYEKTLEEANSIIDTYLNKTTNCNVGSKNLCFGEMKAGWGGNGAHYFLRGQGLKGQFTYQIAQYKEIPAIVEGSELGLENEYVNVKESIWDTVTNDIDLGYYKQNGRSNDCQSLNAKIKKSANCVKKSKLDNTFVCSIKFDDLVNQNPCTNIIDGKCTLKHPTYISQYSGGLTCYESSYNNHCIKTVNTNPDVAKFNDCTFNTTLGRVECETSSAVENSMHECTGVDTASSYTYTCASGEDVTTTGNSGKCNAKSGGNGAVSIIW
ncbi:hypothetical protein J6P92_01595, partial [bacterium]|nr:hypothetical protein [bacterium]